MSAPTATVDIELMADAAASGVIADAFKATADEIAAKIPELGAPHPSWYIIAKKDETSAEIKIYEEIGTFGVTAKQFSDDLETVQAETLHIRLNSYGGEVFDGFAIYNALRAHPAKVIVHVDGIAASAASVIAMAGNEIRMANNAFLMIHEARGGVMGEADDMRGYADLLDKLNDSIAMTYQERAGKSRKYWREKMAAESWFSADESREEGLCDTIDQPVKTAKNRFDFKIYNHAPDAAKKLWAKQSEQTQAPDESPRGDVLPVPTKEPAMAETTTTAPAQPPVAGPTDVPQGKDDAHAQELDRLKGETAEAQFNHGRDKGFADGAKAAVESMKAILAVCPGKPQMAIDAFLSGQTSDAVKLAFDEAKKVEAEAREREKALELDNARLRKLAATGGYPGGVATELTQEDTAPSGGRMTKEDAKAQAEREWDTKPAKRNGFSNKQRYVAYRSNELMGNVTRQVATSA